MEKYLVATAPSTLIDAESARIEEIKTAAGVPQNVFDHFYSPILLAFAGAVQGLPLSATAFAYRNGALEFGLIAGMIALRYAKTQIFFPDVGSEDRRVLEPQCRFAAFVATLASAVTITAQHGLVFAGSKDNDYHPLVCPVALHKWLQMNPTAQVEWKTNGIPFTAAQNAAIAARFIPVGILSNFDIRVSMMIFGAISPQLASSGVETTLERVIRQTIAKVIDHHTRQEQARYGHDEAGTKFGTDAAQTLAESMIRATQPVEEIDITKPATPRNNPAPSVAVAPANAGLLTTDEYMARLPTALREWFGAVIADPNYETVKTHMTVVETGIEIPVSMLGRYGVSGQTIQKMLKDSNVIVGRTDDGRKYILDTALKEFLFKDAPSAS